ncbi:MAG TPA: dynamin family protein [Acidimicrobiales bacterium]|nr:dynamin family protein [Acidimicrobiales bacterium]
MPDGPDLAALATNLVAAAEAHGSPDVASVAASIAEACRRPELVVAVGDFKRGKTSVVNGLLAAAVLPVDDTVPTAVPTVVSAGPPSASLIRVGDDDPDATPVDPTELGDVHRAPGDDLVRIEVAHDARVLQRGFALVDCPPAPPDHLAARSMTLAMAQAGTVALFVTDATQPLTAAEMDLLRAVAEVVPDTIVVITKVDMASHGAAVVAADLDALAAAGLSLPAVQVSCELRQIAVATGDAGLNAESGFPDLVRAIDAGLARARALTERRLAGSLAEAVDALDQVLEARLHALSSVDAAQVERTRVEAEVRAADLLRSPSAGWQRLIADSWVDIQSESGHLLTEALRTLMQETEKELATIDPAKDWDVFEPWVRNQVAARVEVAFADADARTSEAIRAAVAEFHSENVQIAHLDGGPERLAALGLTAVDIDGDLGGKGSRFGGGLTGVRGLYTGPMMLGLLGQVGISVAALAPVGLAIGIGIGAKAIRDERTRQLEARRRKALASARAFIEIASGRARKELQSTLRTQQRGVRTALSEHADQMAAQARARLAEIDAQLPSAAERGRQGVILERDRTRLAELGAAIRAIATGATP